MAPNGLAKPEFTVQQGEDPQAVLVQRKQQQQDTKKGVKRKGGKANGDAKRQNSAQSPVECVSRLHSIHDLRTLCATLGCQGSEWRAHPQFIYIGNTLCSVAGGDGVQASRWSIPQELRDRAKGDSAELKMLYRTWISEGTDETSKSLRDALERELNNKFLVCNCFSDAHDKERLYTCHGNVLLSMLDALQAEYF